MNFVFLLDAVNAIHPEKDTSLAIMAAVHKDGHKVFYLQDGGISLQGKQVVLKVDEVIPQGNSREFFKFVKPHSLSGNEVDIVFIRTDPPFDEAYLTHTWLLDRLPAHVPVVNRPSGIRTVNEKIWVTQFSEITPETYVGRQKEELEVFLHTHKEIIVKPTGSYGGNSVFLVRIDDVNANVILETVTDSWRRDIIAQKYIPAAQNGDKRVLLLNGEPLGAVLRMHKENEHRNNFFSGGSAVACNITTRDKEIIGILKPHLLELGLYFVGIDIIGDYLIEVNVTSPTCLIEMNTLYGKHLEDKVLSFAKNLINATEETSHE